MKIGETISSIEFSDSEKDRIGEALLTGRGLPYEVLISKAQSIQSQDFWRQAQKKFRVNGFREGHPSARSLVLKRALDSLKTRPGHENREIWPLYRSCVYHYVIDELRELNELLLHEDFEASSGSLTEQIFKCIKEKMPLYRAENEHIQRLYDIWGFDRISNFQAIFSGENFSIQIIRRLITSEVDRSKRETSTSLGQLTAELQRHKNDRIADTNRLQDQIQNLEEKIDSSVAILRTEFQNLASSVSQKNAHEIRETFRKMAAKDSSPPPRKNSVDPEALVALQTRIDKLAKKVGQHEESLSEKKPTANASIPKSLGGRNGLVIKSVFSECLSVYSKHGYKSPSLGLAWVVMRILQKSKVIITDRPNLIFDIISTVANIECRRISASPLWLSPGDWSDGVKFLFEHGRPQVLVISDFDVAIQESYLVPVLVEWLDSPTANPFSRVVLVPSKPRLSAVSSRILEICSVLEFDDRWTNRVIGNSEHVKKKCESNITIEPTDILGHSVTSNIEFESHLKRFTSNSGVAVPARLASQFVNIYTGLSGDLPDNEAGAIALDVTVLPWVRAVRGNSFGQIVEESLKVAFGG